MNQVKLLRSIEQDFSDALEALSSTECVSNQNLFGKTKKVAMLLAKAAKVNLAEPESENFQAKARVEI